MRKNFIAYYELKTKLGVKKQVVLLSEAKKNLLNSLYALRVRAKLE